MNDMKCGRRQRLDFDSKQDCSVQSHQLTITAMVERDSMSVSAASEMGCGPWVRKVGGGDVVRRCGPGVSGLKHDETLTATPATETLIRCVEFCPAGQATAKVSPKVTQPPSPSLPPPFLRNPNPGSGLPPTFFPRTPVSWFAHHLSNDNISYNSRLVPAPNPHLLPFDFL
ncbi:hypothetical protein SODALDRAFT_357178 [Sodiomyces alkalinus F11]|uniref:Uncharacterized protein n=1 Tax=Sodiomyces alkalinus (strain CBS 110278 / VKM F-3762 / F11) TaxID=1314773 RepID=A0A3N2Q3A2_SODAK|nr:hypothetical protein SODALDRAFT_357178 [Sodiomyces alkalinus F11]ROT41148.1 hypothetical protein SODALDRAFT_357178 [Sodiomyces alkalinus F11]